MRPRSLSLPPDRELHENCISDTHDDDHHHHHNHPNFYSLTCSQQNYENIWGQSQAQDAAFYAPGNSNTGPMYNEQHDESHEHHQDGTYHAEELMTPAPADGGATGGAAGAGNTGNTGATGNAGAAGNAGNGAAGSNQHPADTSANPFLNIPYGDHPYGTGFAYINNQFPPPPMHSFDLEMSDSDGGAPLNLLNAVINGHFMTGGATVSNEQYYYADGLADDEGGMEEEDEDEEDEEEEEEMMDHDSLQIDQLPAIMAQYPSTALIPAAISQAMVDEAVAFLLQQPLSSDELSLDEEEEQLLLDPFPPPHMSNPNPSILGSENYGLIDFLRSWAYGNVPLMTLRLPRPGIHRVLKQATSGVERVYYGDLRGNGCDIQGLDWDSMNTTRQAAREIRRQTYKNYVNRHGSDIHMHGDEVLPSTENFFRFKKMDVRRDISLAHFQLRSVLACPTRTQAFYPSVQGINVLNTATKKTTLAMNLRAFPGMAAPAISTLDAGCGVLMSGTFNGDYFLQSLSTEDKKSCSEGQISTDISGITNHIKIYKPRRSGSPVAAIASNDHGFRLMDLQTEKFTAKFTYPFALNCSAMSPDGRLRVVVGDDLNVLITNAETGEILQQLGGHRDYGFACDWSDNGYTVATGFQDKTVKIWDARRWHNSKGVSTPLCTIKTEMAGVRNLRFSPTGCGKPILAAAEEADYIHLIDASTFTTKQTIDIFGEIGGVAFTNDGQDFNVLCCDAHRGGLLQFERCSYGVDEPVSGGWRRTLREDDGFSSTWNDVQRRRPPPRMDGPGVF